ncbi:Phage portal protein, lambda family [Methylobrevis pamukkalensis]|uniref:Phage portal protein, lambda family n=1 Tax=Methylobrevis pamukkalensis TaxID=1439726 RepID=A0A1E3H155_9HYPH|nr:Phage portal protein, lambda family [Methylobrevis pamukkalensis]
MICRALIQDGEVLIRRIPVPSSAGLAIPLQIKVIEADHLDTLVDGPMADGHYAVQGVEFDAAHRRVAYHLFDVHPGSRRPGLRLRSRAVPAAYVAHVFRAERPGQVRGTTWLAPVMMRLQDLHDFEDAQLLRQKIAACFSAFMVDADGPGGGPSTIVAGAVSDDAGQMVESFEPGMIVSLPAGRDIRFGSPPQVTDPAFVAEALRAIAAGVGLTYEALTGNLGGVNFSSGRMGWIEMERGIDESRWTTLIPQGFETAAQWILDAAQLAGLPVTGVAIDWTPPRRIMIDPAKETAADRDAIRSGLASWSGTVRERGFDPAKLMDELVGDMKLLKAAHKSAGLTLDIDGSRLSRAGTAHAATAPDEAEAPDNKEPDSNG